MALHATEDSEVMLLQERVIEAQRFAAMELAETGVGGRRPRGNEEGAGDGKSFKRKKGGKRRR